MGARPKSVTQSDIERWEKQRENIDNSTHKFFELRPLPTEVYYAGSWLGEELSKIGCEDLIIKKICFACGQYQSQLKQDWEPAIKMFEDYRDHGIYEEPGNELAKKLIAQSLGPNPTQEDFINYICKNWGVQREKIPNTFFKFMLAGSPKPPSYVTN